MKTLTFTLLTSLILSSPAYAVTVPTNGTSDARIKVAHYNKNDVFQIRAYYGYSTAIELEEDEIIKAVNMGNSNAWAIDRHPEMPNLLFVKPKAIEATTNMTLITDKRVYSFEMIADKATTSDDENLTFRLRFDYPKKKAKVAEIGQTRRQKKKVERNSANFNFNYEYAGAESLKPIRSFDDGKFTYLQFDDLERIPAIFMVDDAGNESTVNFHQEDDYIVVERIGSQFTLRDGKIATCLFNRARKPKIINPKRIFSKPAFGKQAHKEQASADQSFDHNL